MGWWKKFWIVFVSFLPGTAAGALPVFVTLLLGGWGVFAGFSIYRTVVPVDMAGAMNFFSTCWTCNMFSDIIATMSNILGPIYREIGLITIPVTAVLIAIWFAWKMLSGYFNMKVESPWNLTSEFIQKTVKFAFICILLIMPLPRMMTQVAIEPMFNIGLALNRAVSNDINDETFSTCVVATALNDADSASSAAAARGVFSPRLRHNLTCELANVHQMTGLGMTVGWTMMNMSANYDYAHKVLWVLPFFPNVPMFIIGALILVLFFWALLPVPLYFLEIFIQLSMDLIMLPLMLLSWLFNGWNIFPNGGRSIKNMVDDVVSGTLGLAMTGVFVTFAIMILNAIFTWDGVSHLMDAINNGDSKYLMDGLMMNNSSLVTVILMGIFIAMFMSMIPALSKSLFKVEISQKYYDTAKKDMNLLWQDAKKLVSALKK